MPIIFDPDDEPEFPHPPGAAPTILHPGASKWIQDPQDYAVQHVRDQHEEVLNRLGEYVIFVLLWRPRDHELGLVTRCETCQGSYAEYVNEYKQAMRPDCPDCLGTGFTGGYRAKIVRPSLWDFGEEADSDAKRGAIVTARAGVQSTADFRMRVGDWIIRADNTRWFVETLSTNHLRTGFGMPFRSATSVGFNYGDVRQEDPTANAFLVTPQDPDVIRGMLDPQHPHKPVDYSDFEVLRAPLSPDPDWPT